MPELPKVENVRRKLKKAVLNKTILKVEIHYTKIIKMPQIKEFQETITSMTITDIKRKGKHLIFELNEIYVLVCHLRMEGKFYFYEDETPLNKHDHVVFTFTDGTQLRYHDVRKFGTMHFFSKMRIKLLEGDRNIRSRTTKSILHKWIFNRKIKRENQAY